MKKRLMTILLALGMMVSLLAFPVSADSDGVIARGTCGDNLTWELTEGGTLTITGRGEIEEQSFYHYGFSYSEEITSVIIEDGVTSIGYMAFAYCSNLTSVLIPESVTSIGARAFDSCYKLSTVTFLGSAPEFELTANTTPSYSRAFGDVFARVYYPADDATWTEEVMQDYGGWLNWTALDSEGNETEQTDLASYFGSCGDNLTWELVWPGVLTISGTGEMCDFEYDEDTWTYDTPWSDYADLIASVVVQEGVTSISDYAFLGCYRLVSAVLEEGIVRIGDYAFFDCTSLSDLTLSDGLQYIGDSAFDGCALTSLDLPDTLISMGTRAFAYNYELTSVAVPASVTSIGNGLFCYCSGLEYVIFEGSAPNVVEYEDWDPSEWAESKGYGSILETDSDSLIVYYPDDGTWTDDVQHYFFYADRDLYPYTYYDEETGAYYTIEFEDVASEGAGEYRLTDITWVSYDTDEYDALVEFLASEHFSDDYGTGTGSWSWASTYIYACYDAGIITGYEDGDSYSFLPANNLTRAEAATIIARAYGLTADDDAASSFSDVSSDYWASQYIEACVEAGIINGYADGTFLPSQNVTRVELAKMIAVAEELALDTTESSFSDVADTHWGVPYIEACASAGIVNGYTDGTFLPSNSVTRAEAATMIARALELAE